MESSHKKKLLENIPDRLFEKSEAKAAEWLGCILRFYWYLGKRNFKSLYSQEEIKTNKKVGRWLTFFLTLLFIYIFYLLIIDSD